MYTPAVNDWAPAMIVSAAAAFIASRARIVRPPVAEQIVGRVDEPPSGCFGRDAARRGSGRRSKSKLSDIALGPQATALRRAAIDA